MKRWYYGLRTSAMVLAFAAPLVVGASDKAAAQEQPVLDRLDRLERDIRTLNIQLSRGGAAPVELSSGSASSGTAVGGPAVARIGLRMDRLEQDLRSSTGTLEEINHRILQVSERLDKLVGDVDFRLSTLENRLGGGTPAGTQSGGVMPAAPTAPAGVGVQTIAPLAGSNPPATLGTVSASAIQSIQQKKAGIQPTAVAPQASAQPAPPAAPSGGPLPAGTPKEQYTYAFNLLQQTNYDQAEVALKAFIETNGNDPLAGNARYWLGESYYARDNYNSAAQIFFEGYQKDPKGPKAAESLLKLGMSLAGLGKKVDACAAFAKVTSDFPRAATNVKRIVARESKRSGCS